MDIPVFVSCPTLLNPVQKKAYDTVHQLLTEHGMEPRSLGKSDFAVGLPLREVLGIARHCAGGIILGFEQFHSQAGVNKPGTAEETGETDTSFPTPWNNLEAGILFGRRLPLLIFRDPGVRGGIFDDGVSDVFVHQMPYAGITEELKQVIKKWDAKVQLKYYEEGW